MTLILTTDSDLDDLVLLRRDDGQAYAVRALGLGEIPSFITWSDDLATSSSTHQWVSGISGGHGLGGNVALRTGTRILQTQGGTAGAPVTENPWVIIPVSGTDYTKSFFGCTVQGAVEGGGLIDSVMHIGYNTQQSPLYVASEPVSELSFEQDFEYSPGHHQMETHIQYAAPLGAFNVRPFSASFERTPGGPLNGRVQAGCQTRDAVSGDGTGTFAVAEQQTNTTRLLLATDSSSFIRLSATDVSAQGLASAVRLDSGGKATGVAAFSHLGGNPLPLLWADATDNAFAGDPNVASWTFTTKVGGTISLVYGTDATTLTRDTWTFAQDATPTIAQARAADASNPAPIVLIPQQPGAGAASTATKTPGNCIVSLFDPPVGGNIPEFRVEEGGTLFAALCRQLNGSSFGALYLGIDPPAGDPGGVFALVSNGTDTYCNAPTGKLFFARGASPVFRVDNSTDVVPQSDNTRNLGTASLRWATVHSSEVIVGTGSIISNGAGSPNGVVTGNPGDMYLNTSGGAGTTLWVKESGAATNTGWVGK